MPQIPQEMIDCVALSIRQKLTDANIMYNDHQFKDLVQQAIAYYECHGTIPDFDISKEYTSDIASSLSSKSVGGIL